MYLPINPVLVQLGPFQLHWYGITMTLAIFLGALVASRYVARHGEDGANIWDMLLWVLIPAIIGARLYYVFIQSPRGDGPTGLNHYLSHPIEILQVWQGGIHIYGAFIFGGIALLLYLRQRKLPYLIYLDGAALGLALGQAIGRIGNFINQELYGPPTTLPWGLHIDAIHRIAPYDNMLLYPDTTLFQPIFLYELIWDAIGFALLLWIERKFSKRLFKGDLFLLYLIWVPLGRFVLEFMRTDSWFFPGTPFNVLHIIIACTIIGAAITLYRHHQSQPVLGLAASEGSLPTTPEIAVSEQNTDDILLVDENSSKDSTVNPPDTLIEDEKLDVIEAPESTSKEESLDAPTEKESTETNLNTSETKDAEAAEMRPEDISETSEEDAEATETRPEYIPETNETSQTRETKAKTTDTTDTTESEVVNVTRAKVESTNNATSEVEDTDKVKAVGLPGIEK